MTAGLCSCSCHHMPQVDSAACPCHRAPECQNCATPITQPATGRPRLYCSDACRKQHRRQAEAIEAYNAAVDDIHAAGFEIGTAG